MALKAANPQGPPRVVRIHSTLHLADYHISPALLEEARRLPDLEIAGAGRAHALRRGGQPGLGANGIPGRRRRQAGLRRLQSERTRMNSNLLVLAGLAGLLFPAGVALWAGDAASAGGRASPRSPAYLLAAVALGLVGYVVIGFGLAFGGVGRALPGAGRADRAQVVLDPSGDLAGTRMGLGRFRGLLRGRGRRPRGLCPLLLPGCAAGRCLSLLAAAFAGWLRPQNFAFLVMLFGWLLYPLAVAWTWGGGWLWNLGSTRDLGHGFVDAGAGAVLVAVGAAALGGALARLWATRAPARAATVVTEQDPDSDAPSSPVAAQAVEAAGLAAAVRHPSRPRRISRGPPWRAWRRCLPVGSACWPACRS